MRPPNFILIPIFFFFFFINQEEVQSFTGMAQSFLQGMGVTQLTIPPEVSNPVIQPVSKKKKHSIKINTSPSFNNSNHSQDNAPNMNFAILLFGNSNLFIVLQSIPYVGPIAGGIRPGTRLHVEGTVPHNAKQYANIYFLIFISFNGICTILVLWITFFSLCRFQINFKTGVKDADDVAFHFNPRFGHYVYMNNFRNGKWQKEELGPDKPFVKGQLFKLLFLINKDSYEVGYFK